MGMENESGKRKRRGERKDGRILVTLAVGTDENGRTVRKYFYGRTRDEANKKRDKYLQDQRLGISDLSETITVNEWIDIWFKEYKTDIDESTAKTYRSHMPRLKKRIGKKLVKAVSEVDLQSALNEVAGMSTSTIDKYHSLITQLFSRAYYNRIITFDPSQGLRAPKGTKGTHRALERWEVNLILNNWHRHRCGLWAMLMLLLGLRRGEMMALEWKDVDLERRQVNIHQAAAIRGNKTEIKNQTKTVAGMRTLPICKPLLDALLTVPELERVGFVCTSADGKQLTQSAFRRGWDGFNVAMNRIIKGEPLVQQGRRNDLESNDETMNSIFIRTHDLRFTFATALYDAGVGVKAAQYYLGHADIRMTMDIYTKLSKERERKERAELTSFLDSWINIPSSLDIPPSNDSETP